MKELKIDHDFKNLLPPLSEDEFSRLESDILKDGIRENLLIWNGFIIDGHNRYEIATRHKLEFKTTNKEFSNKQEVIQWMLNNQLGRRNLPKEKRVDIILQADELIRSLYEKGREARVGGAEITNEIKKGRFKSADPKRNSTHNTNEEIARMAKTSPATVQRMRKIKNENPELYEEVTQGKKAVRTAYNELPTVKKPVDKPKEVEPKETQVDKPKKKTSRSSQLYDFPNPEITKEETEKLMFGANVTTLFMHLSEIESFYGRTKNIEEVINEAMKRDEASMKDYKEVLEKIITTMEEF